VEELQLFLEKNNVTKIDLNTMLEILKFLKQSELQNETDKDLNEYVDAFTAMGGDPD
jgi:Ca2+-binding EF-hand superfamily protein